MMKMISVRDFPGISLLLLLSLFAATNCRPKVLQFSSGQPGGTYVAMAESLKKVYPKEMSLVSSSGSYENIDNIASGKAHLGISQLDVWSASIAEKDKIMDKVKLLCPIYDEEVHILAKPEILTFSGLRDHRVIVGPAGSGMEATAKLLLAVLQVKPKELINMDHVEIVPALQSGKADAAIVISGAPVEIFSKAPGKSLHFVGFSPAQMNLLTNGQYLYRSREISSAQYAWVKEKVPTVSVDSGLFVSSSLSDEIVDEIMKLIFTNQEKLSALHEKWKALDTLATRRLMSRNKAFFHPAVVKEFYR